MCIALRIVIVGFQIAADRGILIANKCIVRSKSSITACYVNGYSRHIRSSVVITYGIGISHLTCESGCRNKSECSISILCKSSCIGNRLISAVYATYCCRSSNDSHSKGTILRSVAIGIISTCSYGEHIAIRIRIIRKHVAIYSCIQSRQISIVNCHRQIVTCSRSRNNGNNYRSFIASLWITVITHGVRIAYIAGESCSRYERVCTIGIQCERSGSFRIPHTVFTCDRNRHTNTRYCSIGSSISVTVIFSGCNRHEITLWVIIITHHIPAYRSVDCSACRIVDCKYSIGILRRNINGHRCIVSSSLSVRNHIGISYLTCKSGSWNKCKCTVGILCEATGIRYRRTCTAYTGYGLSTTDRQLRIRGSITIAVVFTISIRYYG